MRCIYVSCCKECPKFYEGETGPNGELWSAHLCTALDRVINDPSKMLRACPLSWIYGDDNYLDDGDVKA